MGLCAVRYPLSDVCVLISTLLSTSELSFLSRAVPALTICPSLALAPSALVLSAHSGTILLCWSPSCGTGESAEGHGGGVWGGNHLPSHGRMASDLLELWHILAAQAPGSPVLPASSPKLSHEKGMEFELLTNVIVRLVHPEYKEQNSHSRPCPSPRPPQMCGSWGTEAEMCSLSFLSPLIVLPSRPLEIFPTWFFLSDCIIIVTGREGGRRVEHVSTAWTLIIVENHVSLLTVSLQPALTVCWQWEVGSAWLLDWGPLSSVSVPTKGKNLMGLMNS